MWSHEVCPLSVGKPYVLPTLKRRQHLGCHAFW